MHLHRFNEHRRPRRALSTLGREVTFPKARRHESNFYEGTVGKRSVQASTDHSAYYPATNCEFHLAWSRLSPSAREAHRATNAFGAGDSSRTKRKCKIANRPLASSGIFSSMHMRAKKQPDEDKTNKSLLILNIFLFSMFFLNKESKFKKMYF